MTADQCSHIQRVIDRHSELTNAKYIAGQRTHGGNCWLKPGMLDHALDEAADLPVYLWTLREQLLRIAEQCDECGEDITAARIRFVVRK